MSETVKKSTSKSFAKLERRYDLDWLRVNTILCVFVYHCTKFFDSDPFNIKNNPSDFVTGPIPLSNYQVSAFSSILTAIGLPLFFIIAGMSTFYALGFMEKKEIKIRKYLLLRVVRLIVPYIIGMFTYISLLVFLEWTNKGFISSSFFEFYPTYFNGFYGFGGNFSVMGHHLWFLVILFIFTLLTVHLFDYLRKEKFRPGISKFASFFTKTGTTYLLMIPIFLMEIIHSLFLSDFPRLGGWDFFSYIFFLFIGYLFAYDRQFRKSIQTNFKISIILGILSLVATIVLDIFYFEIIWLTPGFKSIIIPFLLVRMVFAWSCIIIILNLADRYLNKKSKVVKTLNELVLPFYIIHFVVLGIVGFYIVQLELHIISEMLLIFLISLVAIIFLLIIIREFNALRFVFGMQVSRKTSIIRFFKMKNDPNNESFVRK